jgi:hypothetical protein
VTRAKGIVRLVAATLALSVPAGAEQGPDRLLACSAEFAARSAYVQKLGHADPPHLAFLSGRAEIFLRLAEARAPRVSVGCGDSGAVIGLVLCRGPADLLDQRDRLTQDRLVDIVGANRGADRLPTCMEDAVCAGCLDRFSDEVRARYPGAWATTPP